MTAEQTSSRMINEQSDADVRLGRVLETYLAELEAGRKPDHDKLIKENPDIADRLRDCLDSLNVVRQVTHGFGPTLQPSDDTTRPTLGDFRLVREIGRGGMGVVYEAEQISLDRRVALKILPFAAFLDARHLQRFKQEAQAAAVLRHPNIVGVYCVGCERGVHYYAMELIQGRTLAEVIDQLRKGAQSGEDVGGHSEPLRDASVDTVPIAALSTQHSSGKPQYYGSIAQLGIQLAEALEYAHQQGIVHRDIKPPNLMLDRTGKVWISDFGLAQAAGNKDLTMTGDLLGTLRYMSPEQAEGKKLLDHRTDIYSLGVTLYELLTLTPAHDGDNRQQLLHSVVDERPLPPRRIEPLIPNDLETVVLKAMAKRPESRYESALELAEDLRRFLEHKPVKARRVRQYEVLWNWARRNPAIASLTSGIACLLLILGISGPLVAYRYARLSKSAQTSHEQAELQLYVSDLDSAYDAWTKGDIEQAHLLLSRHNPTPDGKDHRGFEWHHLWGRYERTKSYPKLDHAPKDDVQLFPLALSADDLILASIDHANNVKLWDVVTRAEIRTLQHDGYVSDAAFSPDGNLLATGSTDHSVRLWNVATGELLDTFQHTERVASVAFSPGGETLAVGCGWQLDGPIQIYNMSTRSRVTTLSGHTSGVVSLAFTPNGRLLASASRDRTARLWHTNSWSLGGVLSAHTNEVRDVEFGPDNKVLATCSWDGTVKLWDVDTLEILKQLKQRDEPITSFFCVDWSPTGDALVIGARDGQLRLWDLESDRLHRLPLHSHLVGCVRFYRDGRTIVSGSNDGTIRFVATQQFTTTGRMDHDDWDTYIACPSSDAGVLAMSSFSTHTPDRSGALRLWDLVARDSRLFTGPGALPVCSVAMSPDGRLVAVGAYSLNARSTESSVQLWEVESGRLIRTLAPCESPIYAVAFSLDGKTLAVGSYGSPHVYAAPPDTANWGSEIGMWDVATGTCIRRSGKLPHFLTRTVALSPDGNRLAIGGGTWKSDSIKIKLWRFNSDSELSSFISTPGLCRSATFSPNGRLLACGDHLGYVRLWDVESESLITTIKAHTSWAESVSFSPDGRTLASASLDRTVKLWNVQTGGELATLPNHARVSSVAFLPGGDMLAAGCLDRSVKLWHKDGRVELLNAKKLD